MTEADERVSPGAHRRRRWRLSEKRRLVELTLTPGASVAEISRSAGVNANQVFKWRREYERGELVAHCALLPVSVTTDEEVPHERSAEEPAATGSIHIELPGRAPISIERGADTAVVRQILESLCK